MEPHMAVKGVQYIKENYDVEVNEIINERDSRSYQYNALIGSIYWFIKKHPCLNHL